MGPGCLRPCKGRKPHSAEGQGGRSKRPSLCPVLRYGTGVQGAKATGTRAPPGQEVATASRVPPSGVGYTATSSHNAPSWQQRWCLYLACRPGHQWEEPSGTQLPEGGHRAVGGILTAFPGPPATFLTNFQKAVQMGYVEKG